MNTRTTWILLGLLAVVGAVAIVLRSTAPTENDVPKVEKKLLGIESADISRIVITSREGKRTVLEKKADKWRLVEPISAPANDFNVENLTGALVNLKSRGQVAINDTGLDKPAYTVEVQAKKPIKLKVGAKLSVGDTLYVQLEGDAKSTVVSGELFDQLEKPYSEYRQTKLVDAAAPDIKQIEIIRNGQKVAMQKQGADWKIISPNAMPGDESEISSLTSAIGFLTAAEFVTEKDVPELADPATKPRVTIWFATETPATQPSATRPAGTTIRIGGFDDIRKKNAFVSVSNPPAVAKVAATSLEAFNKSALDFRDRKVLDITPDQASKITLVTDIAATTQPTTKPASKTEVSLERRKKEIVQGPTLPATAPTSKPAATQAAATKPAVPPAPLSAWVQAGKEPKDADDPKIDSLLQKLHPLRAEKYLASTPAEFKPAARYLLTINTVAAGGASAKFEVKLADVGAEKPLIGEYNGLVFEVSRGILTDITGDWNPKPKPPPELPQPPFPGIGQ